MQNNEIFLGKILGEIYRLQNQTGVENGVSSGRIYGLLHGFEEAIQEETAGIGFISNDKLKALSDILDEYFQDPVKSKAFKGYYEIEHRLSKAGVDRADAIKILRYLYAEGAFQDLIEKMDSSDSPTECRDFKLRDEDK